MIVFHFSVLNADLNLILVFYSGLAFFLVFSSMVIASLMFRLYALIADTPGG